MWEVIFKFDLLQTLSYYKQEYHKFQSWLNIDRSWIKEHSLVYEFQLEKYVLFKRFILFLYKETLYKQNLKKKYSI